MMMPCEFCEELDKYGLLPAVKKIVDNGVWQDGQGKRFKMIHPPRDPVTGFVGLECKRDIPEMER